LTKVAKDDRTTNYSDDEKEEAYLSWVRNGRRLALVSKELGMPVRNLRNWHNQYGWRQRFAEEMVQEAPDMVGTVLVDLLHAAAGAAWYLRQANDPDEDQRVESDRDRVQAAIAALDRSGFLPQAVGGGESMISAFYRALGVNPNKVDPKALAEMSEEELTRYELEGR
jgi:transposase-like protein